MPQTDIIGTLGMRRPRSVRLGDTMRPLTIALPLGQGVMDLTGGTVDAALLLTPTGVPLTAPTFTKIPLGPGIDGAPRFRLELSADKVRALAELPPYQQAATRTVQREKTYFWRCWVVDSTGARFTLYYGPFTVVLGDADV